MVKPSLAQNRLGGPPTEVPIPSNLPHASTCCGTLFFKPVFKPIRKSQALCECFWHTGNWSNSSTIMQLNFEESRISSICSFQISRVSNQNRLHLCHDRLLFLGWCLHFSYTASATTWQRVSELTGTQSFPTPSHYFFIGNTPLLSLYFSWHSCVRWRAMFALPGPTILGMRSLHLWVFQQLLFAHAWGEPRGRLSRPRLDAAASGGRARPRRGGRAAAEVRRFRGGNGHFRLETPELSQPWNCVGEESGCLLLAFNICPSGSFSCLCMTWCFWYRHQWQVWFAELLVLWVLLMKVPKQVCRVKSLTFWISSLSA